MNPMNNIQYKNFLTLILLVFFVNIIFNPIVSSEFIVKTYDSIVERNILFVGGEGPGNYTYIQEAIDNASDGDTVFVFVGIYYEHIIINKTINLIGEKANKTIIDGNYSSHVINILSDNIYLQNFTIRNSDGFIQNAGIRLNSDNNSIENCIVLRTKTGIFAYQINNSEIKNCNFYSNGEGVQIKSSNNISIENCCFSHNAIGCYIEESKSCILNNSYFHTNGIACLFNGSSYIKIEKCNISDNSVNIGGVFLIKCKCISVNNSILRHNGAGLSIFSSEEISIMNCDLYLNTHFAVSLRTASNDVSISLCNIKDNFRYAFYIEKNNYCSINNNNIIDNNLYGVYSNFAYCNARYNWWGSFFGPSFTDLRSAGRVSIYSGKLRIFPWLVKPLENIGANWHNKHECIDITYENKIQIPGNDTDNDGVPDWWENKWGYDPNSWDNHHNLDPDYDALNNLEECYTDKYGSNPFYRDIFVEIDWMESINPAFSNRPPEVFVDKLISIFKNKNISLHIDIGHLGGGEEIPSIPSTFSYAKLVDLYWCYFLHNDLKNPRKDIFHYGIICNYCPDSNFPFFGWDQLDSFAISGQLLKEQHPFIDIGCLVVGASVHHLGHTMGLLADTHGGIDNIGTIIPFTIQWWKYRNYKSCMNYYYKYKIFSFSDGTHGRGDFNDWENLNFTFFKNSNFIT